MDIKRNFRDPIAGDITKTDLFQKFSPIAQRTLKDNFERLHSAAVTGDTEDTVDAFNAIGGWFELYHSEGKITDEDVDLGRKIALNVASTAWYWVTYIILNDLGDWRDDK